MLHENLERHKEESNIYFLAKGNLYLREGRCLEADFESGEENYIKAIEYFEKAYKKFDTDTDTDTDKFNIFLTQSNYVASCRSIVTEHQYLVDIMNGFYSDLLKNIKCEISKIEKEEVSNDKLYNYNIIFVYATNQMGMYHFYQKEYYKSITIFIETAENIFDMCLENSHEKCSDSEKLLLLFDKNLDQIKESIQNEERLLNSLLYSLIQLGRSLYYINNYDMANSFFDIVLRINKDNTEAKKYKATCYRKKGDIKKSIEILEDILKNDENNDYAKIELLKCKSIYPYCNHFDDIEESFDKILLQSPKNLNVILAKGIYYRNIGNHKKALDIFKKIYNQDSRLKRKSYGLKACYNIGNLYLVKKQYGKALTYFSEIRRYVEDDILGRKNYAWCLQLQGLYDDAIKEYEELKNKIDSDKIFCQEITFNTIRNNYVECIYLLGKKDKFSDALELLKNVKFET